MNKKSIKKINKRKIKNINTIEDLTKYKIVYKAWSDYLENNSSNAFGYSIIGIIETKKITKEQRELKVGKDFCWVCNGEEPLYKFEDLKILETL